MEQSNVEQRRSVSESVLVDDVYEDMTTLCVHDGNLRR